MALTKVTKSGITDNAVDADKIEDGTVLAADLANGAVTADKLASTLDISTKTVTLPNTSVTNAMLAGSIANDKLANSAITVNGTSISLGGSVSAGSLEWQTVKTSGFTAVAGEGYFCNTNGGAFTATLPASPSAGDTVAFKDYGDDFATNALTIARNGKNIQGVANNSQISTDRASVVCVFIDDTKGWLFTNESNVADLGQVLFTTATGGTVTTVDTNYKVHTFTGDGCFVVSQSGNGPVNPSGGPNTVSYLVVAGGGSGGYANTGDGGGGAGGFREGRDITPSYTASPLVAPAGLTITAQTYPITVGAGGGGSRNAGSNSIFSTITSAGGGAGINNGDNSNSSGGSGGGGRYDPGPFAGGSGNTPPVSPSQGNPGGTGQPQPGAGRGGGGGGAGATGGNISGNDGGVGGNGVSTSITGSPVTRAGGGAGGSEAGTAGISGGTGGGGDGYADDGPSAQNGTINTGGGGGGDNGDGGSGVVIIRYKFQ